MGMYLQTSAGVGAGKFVWVQRIFWPNYSRFARKPFMRRVFSKQFFCSCCYFIFSSMLPYRLLENRKFSSWNLIHNHPTEKKQPVLGCARTLSKASWRLVAYSEDLPHTFEVWHSVHNAADSVIKKVTLS